MSKAWYTDLRLDNAPCFAKDSQDIDNTGIDQSLEIKEVGYEQITKVEKWRI